MIPKSTIENRGALELWETKDGQPAKLVTISLSSIDSYALYDNHPGWIDISYNGKTIEVRYDDAPIEEPPLTPPTEGQPAAAPNPEEAAERARKRTLREVWLKTVKNMREAMDYEFKNREV